MKNKTVRTVVLCLIVAAAILLVAVPLYRSAGREDAEDSVKAITETVQKLALQCYVIEGAYPASLDYLEENYGLTVNTKDYKIVYTPFAENLPPDVKVVPRHES